MNRKLLLLITFYFIYMLNLYSQEVVYMPEGALIQSIRNDGESEILIPGCRYGIKMDNINNLYGNYWGFYLVGTVDNISKITVKPYGKAQRIALQKGCGYVAHYNDGRGDYYVRIYVTKMISSTSGEIIGATLLYQTNYQSDDEKRAAESRLAEKEAAKIFWNGDAVPDVSLRRILLSTYDADNDGKISQVEAMKKKSLKLQGSTRISSFYETGIANLKGLTTLILDETKITGDVKLSLPNLQTLIIKNNVTNLTLLDLTGCQNIDTVKIGWGNINVLNLKNCKKLKFLDFTSQFYTTITELLDVSGCSALNYCKLYAVRGKILDFSNNTGLENLKIPFFNSINLSGCTNLRYIESIYGKDEKYNISQLNLKKCEKLRYLTLYNNELNELDLLDCKDLKGLDLKNAKKLTDLDLSFNRKLSSLTLDSTSIISLNLSLMRSLKYLNLKNGKLKRLDVSLCDSLSEINVPNNSLNLIDLTGCKSVGAIFCEHNLLTFIDVKFCDSLFFLNCSNNPLFQLDVTKNSKLGWIQCASTFLEELDISKSQVTEWRFNEPGSPIIVPSLPYFGKKKYFKTLWVNENQKIECYEGQGNECFKYLKDKDINKGVLLSGNEKEIDFKIKVRK